MAYKLDQLLGSLRRALHAGGGHPHLGGAAPLGRYGRLGSATAGVSAGALPTRVRRLAASADAQKTRPTGIRSAARRLVPVRDSPIRRRPTDEPAVGDRRDERQRRRRAARVDRPRRAEDLRDDERQPEAEDPEAGEPGRGGARDEGEEKPGAPDEGSERDERSSRNRPASVSPASRPVVIITL